MKNKKSKDQAFTWGNSVFTDPYMVIKEVFGFENLGHYRNFITDILLYSERKKAYKQKNAGSIIWLTDGMNGLLDACYAINKMKKYNPLELWDSDIVNTKFYSNRKEQNDIWEDFPRTLTQEEFIDPYLTFKKIFRRQKPGKLLKAFKELIEYACGSYRDKPEEDTFSVYFQLTRLFEAAHLIYIREMAQVVGWRRK